MPRWGNAHVIKFLGLPLRLELNAKIGVFPMRFYFVIGETKRFYLRICQGRVGDGYFSGICENIAEPEAICEHGQLLVE